VEIYDDIRTERERAHAAHGTTSMEALAITDLARLAVLVEEMGEVAREFNDARHHASGQSGTMSGVSLDRLRNELVQLAAIAAAWADNIDHHLSQR
jgi:hypothetical protein